MAEANDEQKAAECYVKRYFRGSKGEALEIRKALLGRRRQGHRGVIGWGRKRWVMGCWNGYM